MVDRAVTAPPPRQWWRRIRIRGGSWSVWLVGLLVFLAVFGPLIVPHDPLVTNSRNDFQPPSWAHWFGTDDVGRDVFSRVVVATRLDLLIALGAVMISLVLGVTLGAAAGWAGGWTDRIVSRAVDTIMGFPLFVLAVGIAAGMGNSVWSVVIATSVVNLPLYARTTRSEVNRRRKAAYVHAAQLSGIRPLSIVAFHVMPNVAPILAVQASLNIGWAILNAAGLSFIGLGIRPPTPEWGIMVSDGAEYLYSGEWWLFLFPGLVLVLSILAFAGFGDWLRARLESAARMNAVTAIAAPLLSVRGLSLRFAGRPAPTVDNVSFEVPRGMMVALVGESGSGKSIIAHAVAGILTRAATLAGGAILFDGTDIAVGKAVKPLQGRRIGMVFQSARAALNPTLSVGAQIGDVIARHRRLRGRAKREAVTEALASVLIPDPERRADAYPHELSGGMCQRVMLALAMAGEPDLLIADEPTTGLDTTTQAAILDLLAAEAKRRDLATLFITHDLGLARDYADRVAVLHAGQLVEEGPVATVFAAPRHPYTARLIHAVPAYAHAMADLGGIPGRFPDLSGVVPACRFAERCDRAVDRCRTDVPALQAVPPDGHVACWRPLT